MRGLICRAPSITTRTNQSPLRSPNTAISLKKFEHATVLRRDDSLIEWVSRIVYTGFALTALPMLAGHLLWRGFRQPAYRQHWSERFLGPLGGWAPTGRVAFGELPDRQVLWIHAVSVGETRAAAPLVMHWLEKGENFRVVLTHTTPTGRETGADIFSRWSSSNRTGPHQIIQCYLPYDFPWANKAFLAWSSPTLGVLMETELWPNLLAQAEQRNVPVVLINARLSPRSARRLSQFSWLARPAVARLKGIAAQTESDARGFLEVADSILRVEIVGNMKFDLEIPEESLRCGERWRRSFPGRRIWLAASTRDDEEAEILGAWQRARSGRRIEPRDLLVIVPRHPQRFERVARLIADQEFLSLRRHELDTIPEGLCTDSIEVLLGDSLGDMFAYLCFSDLVLMGGSIPALGGQNPIEACAAGRPVFYGPHMFNFHQIARLLTESGAGCEVSNYDEWIDSGVQLLGDPKALQARSEISQAFAHRHRGATARTDAFLDSILRADR